LCFSPTLGSHSAPRQSPFEATAIHLNASQSQESFLVLFFKKEQALLL